jgi:hypothetical protein
VSRSDVALSEGYRNEPFPSRLDDLIAVLKHIEWWANRVNPVPDALGQYWRFLDVYATRAHATPGFDQLDLICNRECGTDLNPEFLIRVRGRIGTGDITLAEAADRLEIGDPTPPSWGNHGTPAAPASGAATPPPSQAAAGHISHDRHEERKNMVRDSVFISYSHQDERFREELETHLKPYLRTGITAWSDRQIQPGSQWFDEIKAALARTSVAVMLVSPKFLASDFIHEQELGPLLKQAEAGGVRILWVLIRDCAYRETPLKDYQAVVSPPDKPFDQIRAPERATAWRKVCEEIKKQATSRPQTAHRSPPAPRR